jgi:hypothetical protein
MRSPTPRPRGGRKSNSDLRQHRPPQPKGRPIRNAIPRSSERTVIVQMETQKPGATCLPHARSAVPIHFASGCATLSTGSREKPRPDHGAQEGQQLLRRLNIPPEPSLHDRCDGPTHIGEGTGPEDKC